MGLKHGPSMRTWRKDGSREKQARRQQIGTVGGGPTIGSLPTSILKSAATTAANVARNRVAWPAERYSSTGFIVGLHRSQSTFPLLISLGPASYARPQFHEDSILGRTNGSLNVLKWINISDYILEGAARCQLKVKVNSYRTPIPSL